MESKRILLKGEGRNQHVLHGTFSAEKSGEHVLHGEADIAEPEEFLRLTVTKDSLLKHEEPNGSFAEHNTLQLETGNWVMGKQVEYNPFKQSISRIWD
jgi:hypothetical protein